MKKVIIFFNILLLSFLISCTKDEIQKDKKTTMRQGIDDTETTILDFFDRINLSRENPDDQELLNWNYETDSAIWHLESAYNYKYAYPNIEPNQIEKKVVYLTINKTNSLFRIFELQTAFDELFDTLTTQFAAISDENKNLIAVDFSISEDRHDYIILKSIIMWNKGGLMPNLPDGDWKPYSGGMCNGLYPTYSSEHKLMQEIFKYCSIHQQGAYFTNIICEKSDDLENFNQTIPSNFNYAPYESTWVWDHVYPYGTSPSQCIPQGIMNQYKANCILLTNLRQTDLGKLAFVHTLYFDGVMSSYPNPNEDFDVVDWMFGNSHPRNESPEPTFMQ